MHNMSETREAIQREVVRLLAVSPAGKGLHLIGGCRFRMADNSPRASVDVDYHTEADFEDKQNELIHFFKQELLPIVKDVYGYEGSVSAASGPDADTDLVKTVNLAFFIKDFAYSRIELPVDITRIEVLDDPEARTINQVVCMTRSDCDIIESKVIALVGSTFIRDRDIVDIFLFESLLSEDSPARIAKKLKNMSLRASTVSERIHKMIQQRDVRIKAIQRIIDEQLERVQAETIAEGGGAAMVFDRVLKVMTDRLKLLKDGPQ
jgi:hypothetical protein